MLLEYFSAAGPGHAAAAPRRAKIKDRRCSHPPNGPADAYACGFRPFQWLGCETVWADCRCPYRKDTKSRKQKQTSGCFCRSEVFKEKSETAIFGGVQEQNRCRLQYSAAVLSGRAVPFYYSDFCSINSWPRSSVILSPSMRNFIVADFPSIETRHTTTGGL